MGNISHAALTIDSGYGAANPSCQPPTVVPCQVSSVTYTNITQAPGTRCSSLIDFKGKYSKRKRASIAYMESTVVDISIPPSLLQTCFIVFVTYLLYSKTPKQVFF